MDPNSNTNTTQKGLSKIKAVRNPNYKHHGPKSYVSVMNRYGFDPTKEGPYYHIDKVDKAEEHSLVPEDVKTALGGTVRKQRVLVKKTSPDSEPSEVTAEDQQNDVEWLCKVQIGTPPQKMMLDFDTGSADLWVFSTGQSKSSQSGHNIYDPKKSSTSKTLSGKTWKIQYGDGSGASGNCVADTLVLGGLSIKHQTIECATKMSTQFTQSAGDGLLGLAYSNINTVKDASGPDPQATPVENMIKSKLIPKESELFTSAFWSSRDAKADDSFYTFGHMDDDLVKASGEAIHWTEVDNSQGFWSVTSESVSINGKTVTQSGNAAILDTGTTLAMMSDKVVEALYKQIPGSTYDYSNQGYTFPTSVTADDLPVFKVAIGDKLFVIQKEDLAFAPTEDGKSWYGGVQSRGTLPFDIIGDVGLKSMYAVWDMGNKRFGAVPKIEKKQNLTPPAETGSEGGEKSRVYSTDLVESDGAES
ncbi:Uu.00g102240.m01.CDS01 [Anthostomella pinea]|uniref:Uu.00g102240.m01.CDS01 n=1 Tax=Anthostomella pinea TaxID=933095 RepID=A0AAI8YD32_9PEZI|nr:Uu.00g102240.m01.CDS01 [Anthostomella pinea]